MPSKKKEQPAEAMDIMKPMVTDDGTAAPALEDEIANLLEAAFNGEAENGALLIKEDGGDVPPAGDALPEDAELPEIDLSPEAPPAPPAEEAEKPAAKKAAAKRKKKEDDGPDDPALPDSPAEVEDPAPAGDEAAAADMTLFQMEAEMHGVQGDGDTTVGANDSALPAEDTQLEDSTHPAPAINATTPKKRRSPLRKRVDLNVLTLEAHADVETPEDREELVWHEIHNAYLTRRIVSWTIDGVEVLENKRSVAIAEYKGARIAIPMKEMVISLQDVAAYPGESPEAAQNRVLNTMLHSKIDFVVLGIDSKKRSVVASRRIAMLRKRQVFYLNKDYSGKPRIYEGRVVQARVVAVADKRILVEIFGVECFIMARDLAWEWIGNAHERFSVGDTILVRVNEISITSLEKMRVSADVRTVSSPDGNKNLEKCKVQGKYAGTVTDVHRGTVLIRLAIGVNAIAHSCYDSRMPGKKDSVSFVVTHIDHDQNVAKGIITRIIKQNL